MNDWVKLKTKNVEGPNWMNDWVRLHARNVEGPNGWMTRWGENKYCGILRMKDSVR